MALGKHSVLPSQDFYFRSGLTYTERTASVFNIRVLPAGCIFSQAGPLVWPKRPEDALPLLGYLMSLPARSLLELLVGSGDGAVSGSAARHFLAGTVSSIPVPSFPVSVWRRIGELTRHCVEESHFLHSQMETDIHFVSSAQFSALLEGVEASKKAYLNRVKNILEASWNIQQLVCAQMGITDDDLARCNCLVSLHPCSFAHGDVPAAELVPFESLSEDEVVDKAAGVVEGRAATKQAFQADRRLELACLIYKSHPDSIIRSWPPAARQRVSEVASDVVSLALGCAFGRWDIRYATGGKPTPELPDPFASLPVCPPGMLQNAQGLPSRPEDVPAAYPLRIPWHGILVDDLNYPLDIERRVRDAIEIIWKDRAEGIEHEACEILGVKSLRDYFRKPACFFADHLKRYSKSRRQAPIYWPLSTASGSYTMWIYYQRLTENSLHTALADFIDPKLKSLREEISFLRNSGNQEMRLEELADLQQELQEFRVEIERIIKLPWKPYLNDGVLITASPLWKLFRLPKWQKDLKACWEELSKGEYDWAHLAYTIWPARVEEVCKTDRSVAIAHGLEHLCKIEASKAKTKRGTKKGADQESFGAEGEYAK